METPRKFLYLAGAILTLTVVGGSLSSFTLFDAKKHHDAALVNLTELYATQETVFELEVSFKRQIQEWKNILLRGSNPEDFMHYRDAFESEYMKTGTLMEALDHEALLDEERLKLKEMQQAREEIHARYMEGIAHADSLPLVSALDLDRRLRGIDRSQTEALDTFAHAIRDRIEALHKSQLELEIQRFDRLSHLNLAITWSSVALVIVLIFRFRPKR